MPKDEIRPASQAVPEDGNPLRLAVSALRAAAPGASLHGQVITGTLRVGDPLVFSPIHRTALVTGLAGGHTVAHEGENVEVFLREVFSVERGQIASHEHAIPLESNRARARLCWQGPGELLPGSRLIVSLATQEVEGELEGRLEGPLAPGQEAAVSLRFRGALVMDNFDRNPAFGRVAVRTPAGDRGAGEIFGGHYTERAQVKSQNIWWSEGNVTGGSRTLRHGHKGAVLWLTGLSGSGKSTLSRALERELFNLGMQVYVLDGDNVRHGLNANLGFSPDDRVENIRRVAEVAKLMSHAGMIAVTAFISPYRADRRRAREIALEAGGDFIEVFVDAPLAVCEGRDVKGLYRKARAGEIREFTGISAPYEAPLEAEVVVHTDRQSLAECVRTVIDYLCRRLRPENPDFEI